MTPLLMLFIVVAYFILLLSIAQFTGGKQSNEDFFIGNRQSPWYVIAFGAVGASVSGITYISVPGAVGNAGALNQQFSYLQIILGNMVGYTCIALLLLPLYYRLRLTSIYSYMGQRFGNYSQKTAASFFLLSRTLGASIRLYIVAMVLQKFMFDAWQIPFVLNVCLTMVLIWLYTRGGGLRTIIWTDTLQTSFILMALFATIIWLCTQLGWSPIEAAAQIAQSDYSKIFFFDNAADPNYFFKQFLSGAFTAIAMTGLDQDLMQKNISCKSLGEAQKNIFYSSVSLLIVNIIFLAMGALLYLYAAREGIEIPAKRDHLYPLLALNYFPIAISVVFLLGLVAAAYASVDSALTALTTSCCIDILDFDQKKQSGISEKSLRRTRQRVHILLSVCMLLFILLLGYLQNESVINMVFRIAGFTYGPLLGLFAFGLFTRRHLRDTLVPYICIAAPLICYVLSENSAQWFNGYKFGFELLLLNSALTFAGLWAISFNSAPLPAETHRDN
ncbi:MAG: sodium:solute symporter [Sphingobacteriales bacterium]|nr:sodium:solute symporter [Sphingobacteriales bacterium]